MLKGLPPDVSKSTTLVFGNVEAALLASRQMQNQVVALDDEPEEPLVGPLLIVEPSVAQVLSETHSMGDGRTCRADEHDDYRMSTCKRLPGHLEMSLSDRVVQFGQCSWTTQRSCSGSGEGGRWSF